MKIVLIGNYPQDRQESMERFAQMMAKGYQEAGLKAEIWRPKVFFGSWSASTISGFGKWLGYLDKWILFPFILRTRLQHVSYAGKDVKFHVCDHSNAPYLKYLPAERTAITCHDVIAIRGGLGYANTYAPASGLGTYLQKWILANLRKAHKLASVSKFTMDQLLELVPEKEQEHEKWRVIYNGFNADFRPIAKQEAHELIKQAGLNPAVPYLLHIGSSLRRKNRSLLLDMVAALGDKWHGQICFAGKPLDETLKAHARALGLEDRIVSVVKPDHDLLVALYNACEAFVFPSYSEGFGWPVIEAQACGAPVIASSTEPMPEVSGGAALHADPLKPEQFAAAFLSLQNPDCRAALVQKGYENCKRFEPAIMMEAYLDMHGFVRSNA